jgi:hypothetical protein
MILFIGRRSRERKGQRHAVEVKEKTAAGN